MAFERDCKSYPEYRQQCESNSSDFGYADYGYETTRTTAPRVPQMGISAGGHRRTLSGISSSSSNVNPAFHHHTENDNIAPVACQFNNLNFYNQPPHHLLSPMQSQRKPPPAAAQPSAHNSNINYGSTTNTNRMRIYENIPFSPNHQLPLLHSNQLFVQKQHCMPMMSSSGGGGGGYMMHQQQHHQQQQQPLSLEYSGSPERPATLAFEHDSFGQSKLRSSLKKYNSHQRQSGNAGTPSTTTITKTGTISASGTPTNNATPPDSLTSDDSSYLSAKDGSVSSQSRVRFSPETLDLPVVQALSLDEIIQPLNIPAAPPLINRRRSLSRTRYRHEDKMS